jgi:UDP-N-acetylmuramoyl-tripeptide--D-alanyl-D-alanine ligase
MIFADFYSVFSVTIVCFWFFHTLRRTLFFLYFWQLKEYRIDRFVEEFNRRKSIVFSKFFFCGMAGLVLWLLFGAANLFWAQATAVFMLVFLFFLYSFYLFIKNKWRFPVWTKKMLLLSVFTIIAEIALTALFWGEKLLPFILVFEIFFLFFIFLSLSIVQIPVFVIKKYIIKKAKIKIQKFPNLVTIGITGSYGKTTTKEIISRLLGKKYKILKTKEHINTEMGIAKTVLKELTKDHQVFICEMAAYKIGEIRAITDIIKPKIGILTGINQQHLSLFGSQENIIKGKYELIEALPEDGMAFFNGNNKYCAELYQKCKIKKFLYGKEARFSGEENVLGAMLAAKKLGMTDEEIKIGVEKIRDKMPGIEIKKGINGLNIIDAGYSANPDGVMAHLEHLKLRFPQGKKAIIMPCLIELGHASKEIHQRIGQKIGQICDLAIIVTDDYFKEIKAGAVGQGMAEEKILLLTEPQKIQEKIKNIIYSGDAILLEGRIPKKIINSLL